MFKLISICLGKVECFDILLLFVEIWIMILVMKLGVNINWDLMNKYII